MADYIVFEFAMTGLDDRAIREARSFSDLVRQAAETASAPVEVRVPSEDALLNLETWPADVWAMNRDLVAGAAGAIVLLNSASVSLGVDLGMMTQRQVPVLILQPDTSVASRVVMGAPNIERVVHFDPGSGDYVIRELRSWIERLPRRSAISEDVISTDEMRNLEAFLSAYYRGLHEGTLGLSEPDLLTVNIHVETVQLQLRAPEPNRHIIKATLKEIGVFLVGAATGVAGNYLYSLLPHLR